MNDHVPLLIETLEQRILRAHIGLDASFAHAGTADIGGAVLVSPLPDGKILVVGDQARRLNADGSIDSTFVDAGAATVPAPPSPSAAVVIGDHLLLASPGSNSNQVVVRAVDLASGAVDTSYGSNGAAQFNVLPGTPGDAIHDISIDSAIATPDGCILLGIYQDMQVGQPPDDLEPEADVVCKLSADGQLDPTFGNAGQIVLAVDPDDVITPLLVAADNGKFIATSGSNSEGIIGRYNADGSLDQTFGSQGLVGLTAPPFQFYSGLNRQPDGTILVTSSSTSDNNFSTSGIAAFNADGSADQAFKIHNFSGATINNATIDPTGKIIGVLSSDQIFRLNPDGQPDPTFDDDGVASSNPANVTNSIAVDALGRILLADSAHVSRYAVLHPVAIDANGIVSVAGTDSADTISAAVSGDDLIVTLNGQSTAFAAAAVTGLVIDAGEGDDRIDITASINATITADAGNDTVNSGGGNDLIFGGDGNDEIIGNAGNDSLEGNAGDDTLFGGLGADRVAGNGGRDHLYGGGGNDRLFGGASGDWLYGQGGNDQLFGEGGKDRLYSDYHSGSSTLHGGAGNDELVSKNSLTDQLFGDDGSDSAHADAIDHLTSIEALT